MSKTARVYFGVLQVEWVEKASFENIHRLLEVSEREQHYKVLLTSKNLADVRRNPASYSLPIIPRPLSSEIVDGEHFVTADLLRFISRGASTSGGTEAEIADRRSIAQSQSGPSTSNSGGCSSSQPALRQDEGGSLPNAFLYLVGEANLPPEYQRLKRRGQPGRLTHLEPK